VALRYAFRTLAKSRGFTVVAILTLALGIGANSAIFSVVNAVLLRQLPYADPDRLVLLWGSDQADSDRRNQISFTDMDDWRRQNHVFEGVAAYEHWDASMAGDFAPERVPGMQVSDGYFSLMRGTPLLGRVLLPEDQIDGKDYVVVLGYDLWQRKFGGDPKVVGRTVDISGRPYTIVGVMPASFHPLPASLVGKHAELYRPVAEKHDENERASRHLRAIARLKPGVTTAQAQAEIGLLARRQAAQHPESDKGRGVHVVTLRDDLVRNLRQALLVLQGAVCFVLLIACANMANLLLARSAGRRKELAIRSALGAGRLDLARQALTESMLLALAGGTCGLCLASWGTDLLQKLGTKVIPELAGIQLDGRVLVFTLAISLATGVLFGLVPALQSAPDAIEGLKAGGRSSSGGSGGGAANRGVRRALVISQMAFALVLLAGAGLLVRSFARLQGVQPGFEPRNVLTGNLALPEVRYPTEPKQVAFYRTAIERIQQLPGVRYAAAVNVLPESTNFDTTGTQMEGHNVPPGEEPYLDRYIVTPEYFRALSIPLVRGRLFTEQDNAQAPQVALINETAARMYWQGQDPLGKRFRVGGFDVTMEKAPWRTIVGIVRDVYQYGLDAQRSAQLYFPHAQFPARYMTLVVKCASDPAQLAAAVRARVRSVDKDQPLYDMATMEEVMAEGTAGRRFSLVLLAIFSCIALSLAAVGIYGVISYSVTQRTQELGTRMALGAQRRDILRLVLGQGMAMILAGAGAGAVAALLLTRFLASLLFGVSATDALAFGAAIAVLIAVALAACYLPARRAARADPMAALRWE
jgi:putative ABC transport system permease protein